MSSELNLKIDEAIEILNNFSITIADFQRLINRKIEKLEHRKLKNDSASELLAYTMKDVRNFLNNVPFEKIVTTYGEVLLAEQNRE